jgi:hypothetical protein
MQYRRLITALTLISFLPVAAGCSKSRLVEIDSDPASAGAVSGLQAGEPMQISGYTRASDGYRDFDGQVQLAGPDSLTFVPEQSPTKAARTPFTISCDDVTSVTLTVPDKGRTRAAVTLTVLVVGAAVATAVVTASVKSGNMDPWF